MRIIFLGDIVGRAAREKLSEKLPSLIKDYSVDFTIVNGENSAGGFGITEDICRDCLLYTSPSPRDKRQSRMPSSA